MKFVCDKIFFFLFFHFFFFSSTWSTIEYLFTCTTSSINVNLTYVTCSWTLFFFSGVGQVMDGAVLECGIKQHLSSKCQFTVREV